MSLTRFAVPFTAPSGELFYASLESRLRDFEDLGVKELILAGSLSGMDGFFSTQVSLLRNQVRSVIKLLRHLRIGRHNESIQELSRILYVHKQRRKTAKLVRHIDPRQKGIDLKLYRIRPDSGGRTDVENKKLTACFHVPIELQYLIAEARFSQGGIPFLYCSTDLVTAWQELKEPRIVRKGREELSAGLPLNAAQYKPKNSITLLDLSFRSLSFPMAGSTSREFKIYAASMVLTPLLVAVHSQIAEDIRSKAKFRPDYNVPRLISELLTNQPEGPLGAVFDGIEYSSVQTDGKGRNYVFFPRFPEIGSLNTTGWPIGHCSYLQNLILSGEIRQLSAWRIGEMLNATHESLSPKDIGLIEEMLSLETPISSSTTVV